MHTRYCDIQILSLKVRYRRKLRTSWSKERNEAFSATITPVKYNDPILNIKGAQARDNDTLTLPLTSQKITTQGTRHHTHWSKMAHTATSTLD